MKILVLQIHFWSDHIEVASLCLISNQNDNMQHECVGLYVKLSKQFEILRDNREDFIKQKHFELWKQIQTISSRNSFLYFSCVPILSSYLPFVKNLF